MPSNSASLNAMLDVGPSSCRIFSAINRVVGRDPEFAKKTLELEDYSVRSVTLGTNWPMPPSDP